MRLFDCMKPRKLTDVSVPLRGRDRVLEDTKEAYGNGCFRPLAGKAAKRRLWRMKRAAFEDMARLAARQGRES